jgi:hypothetical protein
MALLRQTGTAAKLEPRDSHLGGRNVRARAAEPAFIATSILSLLAEWPNGSNHNPVIQSELSAPRIYFVTVKFARAYPPFGSVPTRGCSQNICINSRRGLLSEN